MEPEDENVPKTYATLNNVPYEATGEFQFEKFLIAENSDSEDEQLENSDDESNEDDEDLKNYDSMSNISEVSRQFSMGFEDWKNMNNPEISDLEKALKLNRNERFMLLQLFSKIKNFLVETQDKIRTIKKAERNKSREAMYIGQIGAPYFKTKKEMFCSDPNPDTMDRRRRGITEIHQTAFTSKWSKCECENLIRGVRLTYNLNKRKALLKRISSLKRKIQEDPDSKYITQKMDEIERMEGEIRNLEAIGINDLPPLYENTFIDWDHISTEYLNDKHNAQECSAFWRIYLHPAINKSNWSSEENHKIKTLAEKYNEEDWDSIAEELGTNRSAFTVFIHYSTSLCSFANKIRFSKEEDTKLLEIIEDKKLGGHIPWGLIAESFPTRNKYQIMHRYKYYLRNMTKYTTKFSDAEDILLVLLVDRFGRNYVRFTKFLPAKSYMQIKARYENHLRYTRVKGPFTLEEDKQLMEHFTINSDPRISKLSAKLNRNRLQLSQRYRILKRYFYKHPGKTLEDYPRRNAQKNETFRRMQFLKYMVDQFRDQVDIPTLEEIESKLGYKMQSQKKNLDMDHLLVEFFSTSYTIKQKASEISLTKIKSAADQIHNILRFFGINLHIPSELVKNNSLDVLDIEILALLKEKDNAPLSGVAVHELFPPNMNSLLGLRGLLLKNQAYKKSKHKKQTLKMTDLSSDIPDIFNTNNDVMQNVIIKERDDFMHRFVSMFLWPALLSIEQPNVHLLRKSDQTKTINERKTVSEKTAVESEPEIVKRKPEINSFALPSKKKQKTSHDVQEKAIQPTRSSSRLKYKKELEEKDISDSLPQSVEIIDDNVKKNQTVSGKLNSNDCNSLQLVNQKKLSCESTNIITKIPSNLVRVDKSEIMKLLQKKKKIKIIKIESVNNRVGSVCPGNQSSDVSNDSVKTVEQLKNLGASGLVSYANKIVKATNSRPKVQNSDAGNSEFINFNKIRKTLNYSLKRSDQNEVNPETSKRLQATESNSNSDLHKLDFFLDNLEGDEDSVIDLTESEVMKKEVDQLDLLIKQEGFFDLS